MLEEDNGAVQSKISSRPFAGRLRREQEGQVLLLASMFLTFLMLFVGLAIDVGHKMTEYRQSQNAADAAALAATFAIYSGNNESGATTQAQQVFQQNAFQGSTWTLALTFLDASNHLTTDPTSVQYVKADVSASFSTYFLRVLGLKNLSVGTTATAQVAVGHPCDFCVLNRTAAPAFQVTGQGSANLTNVGVVVNSNAACTSGGAMYVGGQGSVTDPGGSINVVGCASGTTTPAAITGIKPVSDPLAWLPTPNIAATTLLNGDTNGNASKTLNPGVYSTINDNSKGSLTLNPGIYVITGGMRINGSGPLTGNGVLLYFACPSATAPFYAPCASGQAGGGLDLHAAGTVSLSAMTSTQSQSLYGTSAFAGVLVYYDRNNTAALTINGFATLSNPESIAGTIYAKNTSLVTLAGSGSVQTSTNSLFVVNQVKLTGNSGPSGGFNMSMTSGNATEKDLFGLTQ